MEFPQGRAPYNPGRPVDLTGRARQAEPAPQAVLSSQAQGFLAMLNEHEAGGGALDLSRLATTYVSRAEAEAVLIAPQHSSSGRLGIDPSEFVQDLPDDHIAVQAARLRLAAAAALPAIAAEDAEQAALAQGYAAQVPDEQAAAREKQEAEYLRQVQEANRRGIDPPRWEKQEPIPPGQQFDRPIFVPIGVVIKGPPDPRGYLEPYEHGILAVRERRTTLQAERRDLLRLQAAADARIAATMQEVADLVEALYAGCQQLGYPERVNIGPAYSAFCKLLALTTDAYAGAMWSRAVASWQRQLEE